MKTMHFGIWYDDDSPIERLSLPPGVITDLDSFLEWGEVDREDNTLHLIYNYEPHRLPDPDPVAHGLTATSPVRGWRRLTGIWDRERAEIARMRLALAERLDDVPEARLIDYVVISDHDDWAEAQCIWTLDGILTRCGS